MKVKNLNEDMKFKQKKWLKPYIDLNTKLRARAANKIQENNCESTNKTFSGKFFQNVRKRKGTATRRTAEQCEKKTIKDKL